MSQSPYTPPTSDLSQRQLPPAVPPKSIIRAANLVFLDCVLGCLYLFPGIATQDELSDPGAVIFSMFFVILTIAILVWSGFGLLKGKNGARWTVLVIFALSLLMTATSAPDPLQSVVRKVVDWISILMESGVVVLLLLDTSRQWFKDCKGMK